MINHASDSLDERIGRCETALRRVVCRRSQLATFPLLASAVRHWPPISERGDAMIKPPRVPYRRDLSSGFCRRVVRDDDLRASFERPWSGSCR